MFPAVSLTSIRILDRPLLCAATAQPNYCRKKKHNSAEVVNAGRATTRKQPDAKFKAKVAVEATLWSPSNQIRPSSSTHIVGVVQSS
jgi:hypothetical protein